MNAIMEEIKAQQINLSMDEEARLIAEYKQTKNMKLRERLIRSKYALAMGLAKRYSSESYKFEDAFSDAIAGIIKAIEKHDPTRGPFRLACGIRIRSEILQTLQRGTGLIRKYNTRAKLIELRDAIEEYENGGKLEDIAKKYKFRKGTLHAHAMVDVAVSDNIEIYGEEKEESIVDKIGIDELREKLKYVLKYIDPRDREIIIMRYGLS